MNTDLTFVTDVVPQAIRFVVANNRVPTDRHCTLCGDLIEKGYVRHRLIQCDWQCIERWPHDDEAILVAINL
jgi:hypothetical protein